MSTYYVCKFRKQVLHPAYIPRPPIHIQLPKLLLFLNSPSIKKKMLGGEGARFSSQHSE